MTKTIQIKMNSEKQFVVSMDDFILIDIDQSNLNVDGKKLLDNLIKLSEEKDVNLKDVSPEYDVEGSCTQNKRDSYVVEQIEDIFNHIFENLKDPNSATKNQ